MVKKKGQAFSADILVVIVIVLFGALFLILNKINEEKDENIQEKAKIASLESKVIIEELKTRNVIDSENNVEIQKLIATDLEALKDELGIKNEFAIVFEKDGKLVKIDPTTNLNCLGSSKIMVNGEVCR